LALRYDYLQEAVHDQLLQRSAEVGRLLNGLIEALERRRSDH
jgi:hypothetical protein